MWFAGHFKNKGDNSTLRKRFLESDLRNVKTRIHLAEINLVYFTQKQYFSSYAENNEHHWKVDQDKGIICENDENPAAEKL